jgi:hypothetical protein
MLKTTGTIIHNTISSIHFKCYFAQMVRYMYNIKLYKLQININIYSTTQVGIFKTNN